MSSPGPLEAPSRAARTRPHGPVATTLDDCRLLLVEDDLGDRRLFTSQLSASGLQPVIQTADTVANAVAAIEAGGVDLVLLDLGLPDSQGLETLTTILRVHPRVPVIVLTGRGDDPELAIAAVRAGAQDYLVKGDTGASELARAIRYAIERNDLQQRAAAQLLQQAALHQVEIAGTAAADVTAFVQSAAGAIRAGLRAPGVAIRIDGDRLPAVAVMAVAEGADTSDERREDSTLELELHGDAGRLGTLTIDTGPARRLEGDERRFLSTAAAAIVTRIERIAAATALTARTQQLDTVQQVAEALQQRGDPADTLHTIASMLVEAVRHGDGAQITIRMEDITTSVGVATMPASVAEAGIKVRGEAVGSIQLVHPSEQGVDTEERTVLDIVAAQLGTWWALSQADRQHQLDIDRLARLMQTAPVGLALVGPDGSTQFVNAAAWELLGIPDGSPFPWSFDEEADQRHPLATVTRVRSTGRPVRDVTITVMHEDGSERVLSVNASPLAATSDGRGMVLSMVDVTAERRRAVLLEAALDREQEAAEELRRVSELKDGFLRAVSHELRTPLAAIFGFAETLRDHGDELGGDHARSMLDRLYSNAQRLALLLEDLLDVGRITAGVHAAPDLAEEDLSLITATITALVPIGSRSIELSLEPTPATVERAKVERIVHNLVGNAVRHTPPGSTIRIGTRRVPGAAVLTVEDDGPGVPASDRGRVFEPFVQGAAASQSPSPGTGVGLSLVKQFVDLHGGSVVLDKAELGGARFTVRFPDPP